MSYLLLLSILCGLTLLTNAQFDPSLIPWINFDFNYCFVGTAPCNPSDASPISVVLYKGGRETTFSLDSAGAAATLAHPDFDKSLTSVFFVYGYTSNEKTESSQQMRDAYKTIESVTNFFIFNTSVPFGGTFLDPINFIRVSKLTFCIGNIIADYLYELTNNGGTSANKINLIGHSMGCPTVSAAGKKYYNMAGIKIMNMTGLDPVGPCFNRGNNLNKNDATYVDIIHTNLGVLGTSELLGTADFIPNGGTIMPGCSAVNVSCSHNFGSHLWRESITGDSCIYTLTSSDLDFKLKFPTNKNYQVQQSGYKWDGTAGLFDAYTNGAFPYCKGPSGINLIPK